MTSFLIVSKNKEQRIAYAKEFCTKQDISSFDISLIQKEDSVKQNVNSIGIDDVKQIQKKIFLKPFKSKLKAVIVEDAHLLTTEAQNALLKVLEEPPEHTLLILNADSKDELLPTILSRCQIIPLETEEINLTTRERNSITEFVTKLPEMSVGERLKKAESLATDKEKAIDWIEKVIVVMREQMINKFTNEASDTVATFDTSDTLRKLQSLHTLLKTTNVNPRFAIENTLLNLT